MSPQAVLRSLRAELAAAAAKCEEQGEARARAERSAERERAQRLQVVAEYMNTHTCTSPLVCRTCTLAHTQAQTQLFACFFACIHTVDVQSESRCEVGS